MQATNDFFVWFLYGLKNPPPGIGGWFIFLLLAMAAVIWLMYDSGVRRLPALGWRMAVGLTAMLLLPVILYRFTTSFDFIGGLVILDPSPLAPYREPVFYLGVLGGLLPAILAVGYYVTYQGMVGCPRGEHPAYESVLGQCPGCVQDDMRRNPPQPVAVEHRSSSPRRGSEARGSESMAPMESKRKVQAWLVGNGKTYQLCEGVTTIGRRASNDIYLTGDETVSRDQAKIVQQGIHFSLQHIATRGVTQVNGRRVSGSVLLEADDEIKLGDHTVLRFKS